jgi:HTH-type transcriptional regulator/antitoxin HigA
MKGGFLMEIKPIRTEEDYENALQEIDTLFDADPESPDGDKLDILVTLVEAYESKHYPVALPDPIEAIEYHMERLNLIRKDLEQYIGGPSRVSEILNRKRPLNLRMIRNLHKGLGVSLEVLFQEYDVENTEPDYEADFLSVGIGIQLFEFSSAHSDDKIYTRTSRRRGSALEIGSLGKPDLKPSSSTSLSPRSSLINAYNATESERIMQ